MTDCTHHWTVTSECPFCLRAEVDRLKARFTRLDEPRHSANPMLDAVLMKRNPEFDAWVASLPDTYWARYDLSAARIGWEAAKATLGDCR